MAQEKVELLKGTLDMLILKIVAAGPLHGYAISQRIQQISRDFFQVPQGSLYPALHRLEEQCREARWISAAPSPNVALLHRCRCESDGRRLDSYSRSCLARVLARTKASAPSARTSKPLVHGPGSCRRALMRGMCSSRKKRNRIVPKSAAANRAFFPKMIAAPAATKTTPIAHAQSGRPGNQGGPSPTARRA